MLNIYIRIQHRFCLFIPSYYNINNIYKNIAFNWHKNHFPLLLQLHVYVNLRRHFLINDFDFDFWQTNRAR